MTAQTRSDGILPANRQTFCHRQVSTYTVTKKERKTTDIRLNLSLFSQISAELCINLVLIVTKLSPNRHQQTIQHMIKPFKSLDFPGISVRVSSSYLSKLFIVGKTDSLTTLSRIVEYYTLFSKSLQLIITYYSVCICCISVAHHIILLHLIELNPQGLFPRICSNYVIIFLLLLFFSYQ